MSVINGSFSKPQRSSSVSRSRRATLSVGLPGPLPSNASLSPQRALRARVLRERERSGVGNAQTSDAGGNAKAQEQAKAPSKGPTRSQQMQFAFGSKISKPISSRPGMSVGVGAVAPTRARTTTAAAAAAAAAAASTVHGAVGADAGNVAGRSRRERTSRHEPQEHEQQQQQQTQQGQRASSRGRGRTRSELQQRNPQPLVATTRQAASVAAYQVELEEKDALIADLRRRLEDQSTEAHQEESGGVKPAGTQHSSSDTSNTPKASLDELNEGELAALRAVEEEARADAEEKLAHVEAVAAAALSRAEEMQGRLNTMIRSLKTRRKL